GISAATEHKILGLQADARQREVEAAARWSDVDSAISEHGAMAGPLKGRPGYAPSPSCSVGFREYSKVSLQGGARDAPSLISTLPSEARMQLEDFERRVPQPAQAADVGLVAFTREPEKADELRLILDCRRANQLFHKPPGVSPERMWLTKTSGGDIRRNFCWPPLAAWHSGISELVGVVLGPGEKLSDWEPSPALGGPGVMGHAGHCMGVDSAGVLSFDGGLVRQVPGEARRGVDRDALRFHEVEVLRHGVASLGWHLDGDSRVARPSSQRFGLARQGVRGLLRLRKVAGWQVEGRVAFLCLMRRERLSIFHAVCRFARGSCGKFQPLWATAREELVAFVRATVFVEDVAAVGRVPELSRYRLGGARAREHAFKVAGIK
ncbi:unnamed protein product, partial [Prorocentrum cordatum]